MIGMYLSKIANPLDVTNLSSQLTYMHNTPILKCCYRPLSQSLDDSMMHICQSPFFF